MTVLHSTLLYLLALLTAFPHRTLAQSIISNAALTSSPTPTPTFDNPDMLNSGTTTPTTIPLPPGHGGPSSLDGSDDSGSDVLNYFFLLLVVFAIFIAGWCCVLRRRRRKVARVGENGRLPVSRDFESWAAARSWVNPPWRRSEPRVEGLDERGEAPPPYLPERPAATHAALGTRSTECPIPLQDMHKPPDYEEGVASSPPGQRTEPGPRET